MRATIRSHVAAGALAVALLGSVTAEEPPTVKKLPQPQPRIEHPYILSLLGTWSTSVEGQMPSSGKTQVKLGVGDTTVFQDYAADGKLPDGSGMKVFGHGMYKIAPDGSTLTAWWIDNYLAEPVRLSGPITEKGFDISGETAGGKLRVTYERTADGHVMKGFMNDSKTPYMTDTYRRAAD